MNKRGEKQESNILFLTKPTQSMLIVFYTYLGASILTINSLRSELLHGTDLMKYEPRGSSTYPFENNNVSNFAYFGINLLALMFESAYRQQETYNTILIYI